MINIVDEQVECFNPLLQSAFDHIPFGRFNNPWNDVERENTLCACIVSVDVERDAHVQQCPLGGALTAK